VELQSRPSEASHEKEYASGLLLVVHFFAENGAEQSLLR
jgi:hypothetical protein